MIDKELRICKNDTNKDGDCHLCSNTRCPIKTWCENEIDPDDLTSHELNQLLWDFNQFTIVTKAGVIEGYIDDKKRVLITNIDDKVIFDV